METTYLVTGFPAFRGRKMVEELLDQEPDARVVVVVHKRYTQEATSFLEALAPAQRARVEVLDGDAAAMDLALSGQEYRSLARRVQRVHHLAQVTYAGVDPQMAEAVNIGAAREIIELARACQRLESVVFHSSAHVSGSRTGLVLEEELARGQSFRTPVEKTLARAERLVRQHMDTLPLSVVRPTQIVGDSRTGEVDRFDGPYLLMLLILNAPQELSLPLPTRGELPMHLVPIDWVVRVARLVGRDPRALGKTFHLADPRPLTVRQVFELVAQAGGRRLTQGFIPGKLTRAVLNTPGVNLVTKSHRAFLDIVTTPVQYDTRNTEVLLSGMELPCPAFETYVDALVRFVKQRGQERRDAAEARLEVDDPLG